MQIITAVACALLLANGATKDAREGAPRIKIKVKGLDSSRDRAAVEKNLKAIASVDDVLAGKDDTVTILMKQDKKELHLRYSEITAAVEKAGGDMKVWEEKTLLSGKCRVEAKSVHANSVGNLLHDRKDVGSVSKGIRGKGTTAFEIDAKNLNLSDLLTSINSEKIDLGDIDLLWTSPAKKKTGGGG